MKELVVLSGKGGTGKTSISAALASIAPAKVLADCDVDAANLHLVAGGSVKHFDHFYSGFRPCIDQTRCHQCGKCTTVCRFGAITDGMLQSELDCEGCGVCVFNCPSHAISLQEKQSGRWLISETRLGVLVHAELGLAVENSGKLVSKVRMEANYLARQYKKPLIITDGPPGIGCPAIATLTGASLALAVVEPSLSSIHDLERLTSLVRHFKLPMAVCINKATLNLENRQSILNWCQTNDIDVIGEFPYNDIFYQAVRKGKTIYEMGDDELKNQVNNLWRKVYYLLHESHSR
jgi:MinD superfamily P-loop ATPase